MNLTSEPDKCDNNNTDVEKLTKLSFMSEGFDTKSAEAKTSFLAQRKPTEGASIGAIQQSLGEHFGDIKDPRVERTKKHQLTDILIILILAVIAGAQGWEDIEDYGSSKQQWLQEFLALPNEIPSYDTFRRVFEFINPEELNRCFLRWVETLVTKMGGEIIPIDGKTIKGIIAQKFVQSGLF